MVRTIAVLGATGTQGGSVVRAMLEDESWKVRGITRDVSKDSAKILMSQGVEMVAADINDEEALMRAFEGVQAIFAITNFWEHLAMGREICQAQYAEIEQGVKIANAASRTTSLKHFIWSSLPGADATSFGKFKVPHCDSKAAVDEYIHLMLPELAQKTTFLWVGYYASNIAFGPFTKLTLHAPSKNYIWIQPSTAETLIPMAGDVSVNIGVYAGAILANPEITLPAKYTLIQTETVSHEGVVKTWSEVTGKEAAYIETSVSVFAKMFGDMGRELANQCMWFEDIQGWAALRKGLLTAKDLKIDENRLVGLEGCLKRLKAQLS